MSDNNNKNTSLEDFDWGLGKVVWAKTNMKDPDDLRWSSLAQHSIDTAWWLEKYGMSSCQMQ